MVNNPDKQGRVGPYDLKKWAEKTGIGKHLLIWKFFMAEKEIPKWALIKVLPQPIQESKRACTYLWQKDGIKGEELIRIDIIELVSWRRAHEILLEQLIGNYQAPELPDAVSRKIEIGDVAFIGFGEPLQSIIFARANVLVRIHSVGKRNVSIVDIAKQMDEVFISKPQLSEKGIIPEIGSFSAEMEVARIGGLVPLSIEAKDPLDRPLWYKLVADQGELFIRDDKVCFSSEMPGRPEISLFATNENGFVAGKTFTIRVE